MNAENHDTAIHPTQVPQASTIMRDALVLQAKLVVDGMRDALLIPVSLVAAIISVFQPDQEKGKLFYEVVRAGRSSERWINLFGAADRIYPHADDDPEEIAGLDELLAQVEGQLISQYRGDGAASAASHHVDSILRRIRATRDRFSRKNEDKPEK